MRKELNSWQIIVVILMSAIFSVGGPAGYTAEADSRNFTSGHLIPDESYCDQPRVVVTSDGTWVCILTTGPGHEGSEGQHVVATRSNDRGKTWSPLVDVEPAVGRIKSSYAIALITPFDRVYAFYTYNGDGVHTLPDGKPIRDDTHGWYAYRFSDDEGRTWSPRYRLPMRVTEADRTNDWGGKVQMFWAVGTPTTFNGSAIFGLTKLQRFFLKNGEGWFFRSDNILSERDPDKLEWVLLPDGEKGLRAEEFGSTQEEHDVVHLRDDDLFCVYRTEKGFPVCSYSRDGGHSWEAPKPMSYTPGGRIMKNPRACAKIWPDGEGRYLFWYHNNGTTTFNNGPFAGSRNIAWLSAGRLKGDRIHWSQPEIVAYVDGGLEGCSYPDMIVDGGRHFIVATQKTEARVLEIDPALLDDLWGQDTNAEVAREGLVLDLAGEQCEAGTTTAAPRIPLLSGSIRGRDIPLGGRGGLTIDCTVRFEDLAEGQVLLDSRTPEVVGYVLRTTDRGTISFAMNDGWSGAFWECDEGVLEPGKEHNIAVIVDGGPNVICFMIDGVLLDGGSQRPLGFGRFNPTFKDISGGGELKIAPSLHGDLKTVRIYNRALRVSEVVGNHRSTQ